MEFMDLKGILNEHNLSIDRFAELIHCDVKRVRKYMYEDYSLSEGIMNKIEKGLDVLQNSDIVWPVFDITKVRKSKFDSNIRNDYWNEVEECDQAFVELLEMEV
jgi:hypothetical protein